jgi:D-glycero-alpha-D-manno-heptose 1-phosphate guanylyltransferase
MQAVLLCGGKGTRLGALYPDRPKALVPICGRPFIEWQVDWLLRNGVNRIHLAAGHKAELLMQWSHVYGGPASITVSTEPSPLGTGGGLKFVASSITDELLLVLNGDSLMPNLDLREFQACHNHAQGLVTIAVTRIRNAGRFGTVEFSPVGAILAFLEKADRLEGWINGGFYIVPRAALADIPAGRPYSLETEWFPTLVQRGAIFAFPTDPPLLDMGTPEGIRGMEQFLGSTPTAKPPT